MKSRISTFLLGWVFLCCIPAQAQLTEKKVQYGSYVLPVFDMETFLKESKPLYVVHRTNATKTISLDGELEDLVYTGGVFLVKERVRTGEYDSRWLTHIVDLNGDFLARDIPYSIDDLHFQGGRAYVYNGGDRKIIDTRCNVVADLADWEEVYGRFVDGVTTGYKKEKGAWTADAFRWIDADGKEVYPELWKSVRTGREKVKPGKLVDGIRRYQDPESRLYGYIDADGKILIKAQYKKAGDFSEGAAAVLADSGNGVEKWGFIGTQGEWVIEPKFSMEPRPFDHGWAPVRRQDGSWTFYNRSGKTVDLRLEEVGPYLAPYRVVLTTDSAYLALNEECVPVLFLQGWPTISTMDHAEEFRNAGAYTFGYSTILPDFSARLATGYFLGDGLFRLENSSIVNRTGEVLLEFTKEEF